MASEVQYIIENMFKFLIFNFLCLIDFLID
jgi:hypothetical protein